VMVAFFLDAAGDLAWDRNLLGCLHRVICLIIEYDGRLRVGEQEWIRDTNCRPHAVFKAIEEPRVWLDAPAEIEPCQRRWIIRRRHGHHDLLQHPAINDGSGVRLSIRQVSAIDRDRRWLAGHEDAGMDGIDPRPRRDGEPIEMFRAALSV